MNPEAVRHIASLARLEISEPEIERAARDLERVLNYFESIRTVDLSSVSDAQNPHEGDCLLRPDLALSPASRDDMLKCAPLTNNGQIIVPRVIE